MWKKVNIKYRIAVFIAFVSIIIAIANIFLMNETIRTIVSIAPVIVLALDCFGLIEENVKLYKRLNHELDNHLFNKKEIVEAITEAIEEAEADGRN